MTLRAAVCAYPVEPVASFSAFRAKQQHWVEQAARAGARLLVFPEYASLELGPAMTPRGASLGEELACLQQALPEFLAIYRELATRLGIAILSPSFPERVGTELGTEYRNRARLHTPGGAEALQEKLLMTRFEREQWKISPGANQRVFETAQGTLGVAICYDAEFPLLVRRQVAAGAQIVMVPSCTDTRAGHFRVQLSCRARALENQCYVLQASTVGRLEGSQALDENTGAAGVYGPVDHGFPSDGVIALGEMDRPGWVYADLELERVAQVRAAGQVKNHEDWERAEHLQGSVERVRLA